MTELPSYGGPAETTLAGPAPVALQAVGWQHDLVRILDGAFASQRGRLITGYLAASGLVDSPLGFLADYEANREAVDLYLAHMDLHAVIAAGEQGGDSGSLSGSGLVVGLLLGIASTALVVKFRKG